MTPHATCESPCPPPGFAASPFGRRLRSLFSPTLCVAALLLAACAPPASDDDVIHAPEISGSYEDNFGGDHTIGVAAWDSDGALFWYTKVENTDNFLIAQNDSDNSFNPDLYSRFDWTTDSSGDLYYCQVAYNAASAADAEATAAADTSQLGSGCGGFSWSKLTPQ